MTKYPDIKDILSYKDLKRIVFILLFAISIQTLARQYIKQHPEDFEEYVKKHPERFEEYLKDHPELFEKKDEKLPKTEKKAEPETKNKTPRFLHYLSRGGAFNETLLLAGIGNITRTFLFYAADHAIETAIGGLIGSLSLDLLSKLKRKISNSLFPSKKLMRVSDIEIFDQCPESLNFLAKISKDGSIPYEKLDKLADSGFRKLNLEGRKNRIAFIICMLSLLTFFFQQGLLGNYYMLIEKILTAFQEGKISKGMVKTIFRQLKKRGIPVPTDLIDSAAS